MNVTPTRPTPTAPPAQRLRVRLTLEYIGTDDRAGRRLAMALKAALRTFGFRALEVAPVDEGREE